MDLIFNFLEKVEEKLGHSPHPAIVSLPIGAWTVSAFCDVLGLLTGRQVFNDTARISMGIGLAGAVGAVLTGIHDYSYIPRERPTHDIATSHALLNSTAATLFATSFIMRGRELAGEEASPSFAARAIALSGWGLSLYSAWLGGILVEGHGEAVKPVIRWQAEEERRKASQAPIPAAPQASTPFTATVPPASVAEQHTPGPG